MRCIPIDRIIEYCRAYDELYGDFVESKYEGDALAEWILECDRWFTDREKLLAETEGDTMYDCGHWRFENGNWRREK